MMFVLIGVAAVLGVLYPGVPSSGSAITYSYGFGSIWNLVGLFFVICFFVWIFGGWGPWGRRRYRYRRYGAGDEYSILRERYAKGEITKDQFDQMTRDLEAHEESR